MISNINGTIYYPNKHQRVGTVVNDKSDGGDSASSDFSTAQVTIVNNLGEPYYDADIPVVNEQYGGIAVVITIDEGTSIFTVPLHKNRLFVHLNGATASGDISYDDLGEVFVISGNGTITINE